MVKPLVSSMLCLVIGLVAAILPATAAEGEIEWLPVKRAYNKAMQENKPLVVYLTKPTCPWCRRLEKEVLSPERFNAYADQAVFAKADPRADKTAGRIADSIKISGYPTVAVMYAHKDGLEEAGKVDGYYALDPFMEIFEFSLQNWKEKAGVEREKPGN